MSGPFVERIFEEVARIEPEETGLPAVHPKDEPSVVHVDVHAAGAHLHLDLRYLLLSSGAPAPPPDESQLVRWFSWDEAFAVADPGLIGALEAARRFR